MTANSTGTGQPTGTIREAAGILELALTPEGDNQDGEEGKDGVDDADRLGEDPKEGEETPGADDDAAKAKAEDEDAEGKGDEDEDAAEGEESDEGTPSADQTFTVRIDGKEEQVPLAELLAGYSRTSDYTRKTQQVAETRKHLEAEAAGLREERAEYAALLPKLREALEAGMGPEPDWAKLRQEDPAKAAVAWQEREERRRKLEAVRANEKRVADKVAADQAQEAEQIAIEQHNKLIEKLPAWRDEKVAGAESVLIRKTLAAVGYGPDEMEIYDHRAMIIARKAALYDQSVARQAAAKKKVVKAPIASPGGGARKSGNQAVEQASSRFNKSGSVRDAARLFENLLS